jgi:outer membrane protein assembly factor BamB
LQFYLTAPVRNPENNDRKIFLLHSSFLDAITSMNVSLLRALNFSFFLAVCLIDAKANWPQWRGPGGLGVSDEKDAPTTWSPTNKVLWETPIPGRGLSSPVVWEDRIFLTSAIEGGVIAGAKALPHKFNGEDFVHPESVGADRTHRLIVLCLDAKSGRILWERTAYEGRVHDARHRAGSFASLTPVTDGKHVFAFFGGEGLYAYDFEGRQIWKQSIGALATLGLGPGASPVLYENAVIVQCDQDNGEGSFLAAFDKESGKERWRKGRNVAVSWATPIIVKHGSRVELITSGNQSIISYNPTTGEEWWHINGLEGNAVPSPVAGHGLAILTTGYPQKKTLAIQLGASGDLGETNHVAWSYAKGSGYVPSPILYGDYLYLMTDSGLLTCLDAKTGEVQYEGARLPESARFVASPVAVDGQLLLTSEKGDTFVIKAGKTHEVVRKNSVGEPVSASPAIADGKVYLRGLTNLFGIGG